MTLQNVELAQRKRFTSHYPVLLSGETGLGKSYAFANMPDEDKPHTVIFNFDGKAISEDDSQFAKVYHSFDFKDIEMVDKIEQELIKCFAYDKCDRVLVDTFTLMTKLFNRWASEHFNGYDVWAAYNNAITQILECVKSCVLTYGKFAYITAHYPPKVGLGGGQKRYVTTKGSEHKNIIEESFSTVVESTMEDRQFFFEADVFDQSNTTKTKTIEGYFKIPRQSVDDLEKYLNKLVKLENGKLVNV